jgi:hypothetical protein
MFKNFFQKIAPFMKMSKNIEETEGPQITSQYGAYALRAGLLARLYARIPMHTPTRPGSPTLKHARTRKHAYTDQ